MNYQPEDEPQLYLSLREAYPDATPYVRMNYQCNEVELVSYPFWEMATTVNDGRTHHKGQAKIMVRTRPGDPASMIEVSMDDLEVIDHGPTDEAPPLIRGLLLLAVIAIVMIAFVVYNQNHGG